MNQYLNDISLHKNDIIKKSPEKWKQINPYSISTIYTDYTRAVTNDDIFIFIYQESNTQMVANKLHSIYNKSVFIITNNMINIKRIASKLLSNTKYIQC